MTESTHQTAAQKDAIHVQVRKQTLVYILAALGFVAGLAWNEAIKGFIELFFPLDKGGLIIKFCYALLVTAILVIASILLARDSEKK